MQTSTDGERGQLRDELRAGSQRKARGRCCLLLDVHPPAFSWLGRNDLSGLGHPRQAYGSSPQRVSREDGMWSSMGRR